MDKDKVQVNETVTGKVTVINNDNIKESDLKVVVKLAYNFVLYSIPSGATYNEILNTLTWVIDSIDINKTNNNSTTEVAVMKKAGPPIILTIFVLLSSLGLIARKKIILKHFEIRIIILFFFILNLLLFFSIFCSLFGNVYIYMCTYILV